MKLSIWILADWLKDYHPRLSIKSGKRVLHNARLFSSALKQRTHDIYIGAMKDFIDCSDKSVICVQGKDMMILESEDIDEVFNRVLDAFDYYNIWSDHLQGLVRSGASIQELLDNSTEIIPFPICTSDPGYLVAGHVGLEKISTYHGVNEILTDKIMPLDMIQVVNEDKRLRIMNSPAYLIDDRTFGQPTLCRNLFSRGKHIGWVIAILPDVTDATMGMHHLMDELGTVIEYWSDFHSDRDDMLSFVDIFLKILHGEDIDKEKEETRLRSIDWRLDDPKRILLIHKSENTAKFPEYFKRKLEQLMPGCFLIPQENRVIVIVNCARTDYFAKQAELKKFLLKMGCFCGCSPAFLDLYAMKEYVHMAEIAILHGDAASGSIIEFSQISLLYALDTLRNNTPAETLHPVLGILRDYDRWNHTALYETLYAYLQNERNYVKTASALYIHRNTLVYRIQRIRELTQIDLEDANIRLHLLLSFAIEKSDTGTGFMQ